MGFCNNITPQCDVCFEVLYGECNDVLTISLGLTPSTTFFLNLTDKFDIVTPLTITTDGSGDFTITQTWVEFFGDVEVEIFTDSDRTISLVFVQNTIVYHCVILTQQLSGSNDITPPDLFDINAQTYFTAANITDAREKDVVNTLVVKLKSDSIWDKISVIYPISPTSLSAAEVNLKNPGTNDVTWVNTPTHSSTGVDYNGATQYGMTGFILPDENTHMSVYIRENLAVNSYIDMGAESITSSFRSRLQARRADDSFLGSINHNNVDFGDLTDSRGHILVIRTSVGSSSGYRNGLLVGSGSSSAGYNSTREIYIGAHNNNGVVSNFTARQAAFYTMSGDLNSTEIANLFNAIQTYQTNVITGGREV